MKHITFSIGEVVRKCDGVTRRQLRNWEEAGYIQPERVVCGERAYRRYTEDDIALIVEIGRLLSSGFTLKSAVSRAKENLKEK